MKEPTFEAIIRMTILQRLMIKELLIRSQNVSVYTQHFHYH